MKVSKEVREVREKKRTFRRNAKLIRQLTGNPVGNAHDRRKQKRVGKQRSQVV